MSREIDKFVSGSLVVQLIEHGEVVSLIILSPDGIILDNSYPDEDHARSHFNTLWEIKNEPQKIYEFAEHHRRLSDQ